MAITVRIGYIAKCVRTMSSGNRCSLVRWVPSSNHCSRCFFSIPGTEIEVKYALHVVGIGSQNLQLEENGDLALGEHRKTLQSWKQKEHEKSSERKTVVFKKKTCAVVESPKTNDVLLGRGKQYLSHPGNMYLDQLVDQYRGRYFDTNTSHFEKTAIIQMTVQLIHDKKGRFLERNNKAAPNVWIEVSDDTAWAKVSRRFRK